MKLHLSLNFDRMNNFLEIDSRDEVCIIDFQGQSFIIISIQLVDNTFTIRQNGIDTTHLDFDDSKVFKITNANLIGFIPIDGRNGLLGFGKSHCDFVFFDENNFCFVEFKLNATSLREGSISNNRRKAIDQLKNTIALFNAKLDRNYQNLVLEAYVCTPEIYPRENASWQELAKDFLEEVGFQIFEKIEKSVFKLD
ncbi:hypothetical protein [Pseudanabaena cinerea]|nr:hypothetical protein [Pseudanabaena cinerea]